MKNEQVARIFRDIARLLDLKGENVFRIRAYEKAAELISGLGDNIEDRISAGTLEDLPGIGHDLAGKIKDISATGTCPKYEALKQEIPESLLRLFDIPGLGPKSIKLFYDKLKIDSLEKLEQAARSGALLSLPGVKEKTVENVLKGIELLRKGRERTPLARALALAESFSSRLENMKEVKKCQVAGSVRRRKETVKDIDILVTSSSPEKVIDKFISLPQVKQVLAKGDTKSSIVSSEDDIQVDLRVVEGNSFGSALLYFTGSKQFNIKLRQMAVRNNMKINEYGVFTAGKKKEKFLAGKNEREIFDLLGLEYIPPEMREDRGEIERAAAGTLPGLITLRDIRGDLHVHSTYSDGKATIRENALAAREKGYVYLGLVDHSQSLRIAGGLSEKQVRKKIAEIKKLNKELKGITLLCGTEADILSDGSIDYADSLLKEFDLVIAAVHSGFKQTSQQMTRRLVSACKNKYVNIIAHPTGRLYGSRDPYEFDLEEVLKSAADNRVAMEINASPDRMDFNDLHCLQAAGQGVKLALGTDAHMTEQMSAMDLGVSVARRAWLGKKDVLNCWDLEKLKKWLKK